MDGWTIATPADDPFADEAADVPCDPAGVTPEDYGPERALSVSTRLCGRVTVVQPSLVDVHRGDRVHLRAWHDLLTGPDGAEAVFALALDGEEIWRGTAPIPSYGGIVLATVDVDHTVRAGAQVAWHVHNHGANSYHLFEITDLPPGTEPAN
jgi:hypothetical protein